jgi:hypothetical protein
MSRFTKAESILMDLRNRPRLNWDENPPFDIYEEDYRSHRDALNKIVQAAKYDLNAKKT